MELIVRIVAWLVIMSMWSVIGFFVWVPLLSRAVALYSALVLLSILRRRDIEMAQDELDRATRFWFDGFRRGHRIITGPQAQGDYAVFRFTFREILALVWGGLLCGSFWFGLWLLWGKMFRGSS
jgi:hypothetical protein